MSARRPKRFPARQTLEASTAVARVHQLWPKRTVFIQQNTYAIDAGVFHNDVISVGNQNVFLCHEYAFKQTSGAIERIRQVYDQYCGDDLIMIGSRNIGGEVFYFDVLYCGVILDNLGIPFS